MPTLNARRHKIPLGTELTVNRATIFNEFGESIRDVVPVSNTTDRGQLVADLTAAGETPSATQPLVVLRADARGMHRIEYTTDGTNFIPASGVMQFTNKAAADAFGTANSGLLSVDDRCFAGGKSYYWSGSNWDRDTAWTTITLTAPWVNFGAPFRAASYIRENGWVSLRGQIKSGGIGVGNPIGTLPTGFRPVGGDEQFLVPANLGHADLRIDTAGVIYIAGFQNGGNNGVVGLTQVRFSI